MIMIEIDSIHVNFNYLFLFMTSCYQIQTIYLFKSQNSILARFVDTKKVYLNSSNHFLFVFVQRLKVNKLILQKRQVRCGYISGDIGSLYLVNKICLPN